ncbi:Receptor-like protein kinase [Quillaja saponaria]|uniref:non-specific serine/threonine protein kinase n=1 Tax=Quillaja saponaria TaxID=32244 RepID=A0AAD7VNZ8_QUISA|nr:Receptor-like protein kinase [Quillaja saponaria]
MKNIITRKKDDIYEEYIIPKENLRDEEYYYNLIIIPKFFYSDIYLATNGFATKNLIGKGAFASVYKAEFRSWSGPAVFRTRSPQLLAVKVLDLKSKSSNSYDVECEAWRNTRHRNLVRIVTSCSSVDHTGAEFKALIMEYMSNGNLNKWLYPKDNIKSKPSLSLTQRLNIAIDVASALDYLHHDCNPPVVHCDLKPGNVLIDENMVGHVGDFGLSRIIVQKSSQEDMIVKQLKASTGFFHPENGLDGKAFTSRDVYSFGIILLEMFNAKKPSEDMFDLDIFASAVAENEVLSIADPRLFNDTDQRLTQSSFATHSSGGSDGGYRISNSNSIYNGLDKKEKLVAGVIRVGLSCAEYSAKDRITIWQALKMLQEIKKMWNSGITMTKSWLIFK